MFLWARGGGGFLTHTVQVVNVIFFCICSDESIVSCKRGSNFGEKLDEA